MDKDRLEQKARWLRGRILQIVASSGRGHIGGAFSCVEILVTLYYGGILRFEPKNPRWPDRDRFILSKGHSCVALFPILADLGFFPSAVLDSYCTDGCMLGGHPDRSVPGIEADTGSLGHGLGIAAGMALAAHIDHGEHLTVALLGDGECYEGSVWESALFAGHHQLNRLVVVVDRNRQCATDFTEDCNRLEPFADKWEAFGWESRVVDGHSVEALRGAFCDCRSRTSSAPLVIIAQTIKGKGVSFMEKSLRWHHGVPQGDELEKACRQLQCNY
jgi:transketolase